VSGSALFMLRMFILFQGLMEDLCLGQDINFLQGHGLILDFFHFLFHLQIDLIFRNLRIFTDVEVFLVL
jgi:hypothetical protein